jgi:hypothetical protein
VTCPSRKAQQELGFRLVPLHTMLQDCYDWLIAEGPLAAREAGARAPNAQVGQTTACGRVPTAAARSRLPFPRFRSLEVFERRPPVPVADCPRVADRPPKTFTIEAIERWDLSPPPRRENCRPEANRAVLPGGSGLEDRSLDSLVRLADDRAPGVRVRLTRGGGRSIRSGAGSGRATTERERAY